MNENDNKTNNENLANGDGASGSENIDRSNDNEEVKAFDWSYTDETAPDGQDVSEDDSDERDSDEKEDVEQAPSENNDEQNPVEDTSDKDEADEHSFDESASKKCDEKHTQNNIALILSIALSGCAVILLLSLALASVLNLFPANSKNNVIYVPIASPSDTTDYSTSSDMLEDFMDSVVIIKSETSSGTSVGTGIILSDGGYIVTNHHVIENATNIYVWLYGSDSPQKAVVIGHKEMDDIAVIKINKTGLRPATFAKSSECRLGEHVYAIGTPEGDEFGWSVTQGIISCPDREIKLYNSDGTLQKKMHVVQTDASVNPGNSGGPLINSRGEVVGIITLKLSDSAGMGFAIPSDGALIDVEAIIEKGHADDVISGISIGRPLIGITCVGVTEDTWYKTVIENGQSMISPATQAEINDSSVETFYAAVTGVRVSATSKGLDARNKLKEGDIITKVNNIDVSNTYEVMDIINEFNGGDEVSVTFYRDGDYYTVTITLGTEQQ